MKIRLKEVPAEGRDYVFDRESRALDRDLESLLGKNDYRLEMKIQPINGAYELRGHLKTTVSEICSSCGYEISLRIDRKLHEILFEEEKDDRKAQSVHGNQAVDYFSQGPSMTPVYNEILDVGQFAHETIALVVPFYPLCGDNGTCLRADEAREIRRRLEAEFAMADQAKEVGHPAFSVLKGLSVERKGPADDSQ